MSAPSDRQRIDKWLWHARVVRTRSAAAELVTAGHVRINGARVAMASRAVRLGDVVTIALDRRVRLLKVTGYAARRGSAEDARGLFEDLTPLRPARPSRRSAGAIPAPAARPNAQRREIDRLRRLRSVRTRIAAKTPVVGRNRLRLPRSYGRPATSGVLE